MFPNKNCILAGNHWKLQGFVYIFGRAVHHYFFVSSRALFSTPPTCVHDQGHHVATLSVLVDPLLQPQHAFYTACALLVEFNTFLLILRRRVSWGRYLEVPFAVSWVALRLIW